jgi:hypothetical protein
VDPDWAIALWNNPAGKIFKKQKKFRFSKCFE